MARSYKKRTQHMPCSKAQHSTVQYDAAAVQSAQHTLATKQKQLVEGTRSSRVKSSQVASTGGRRPQTTLHHATQRNTIRQRAQPTKILTLGQPSLRGGRRSLPGTIKPTLNIEGTRLGNCVQLPCFLTLQSSS